MSKPITLYFEVEDEADLETVKARLADGLAQIPNVEESEVQQPEQRITGIEIAAALGAAILIANSAKDAVDALDKVVTSLTKLIRSIKGLKSAIVETPSGPKKLEEVTGNDLRAALGG